MSKYPHQQPFNYVGALLSGERVSKTLEARRKDWDVMMAASKAPSAAAYHRPGSNKHR